MAVLAIIALCEQTALNSISPYLPDMASTFPNVEPSQVGMYVGTIASSFALAQFLTNYFWGWLSDRVGRKPVILLGTILTAACFVAFGFCKTLWQAIVVQMLMGVVNGNQGVVSTCLGEITDRSNQSRAFTYLPVIYGIGGITGPMLGGLLVGKEPKGVGDFPYLAPNLASAGILLVDFVVTSIFLEESLQDVPSLPKIGRKVRDLFTWLWQFTSSTRPSYLRSDSRRDYPAWRRGSDLGSDEESETDILGESSPLFHAHTTHLHRDELLNRDMILLLASYLIFALANVSYNSLYPIFAQAQPPTGRALSPREIGLTQSFAGLVSIGFQICIFGKMRDKMGNRWSYRAGLLGFVIAFALMPFVGHKDEGALKGKLTRASILLTIELCVVLLIKTVAAVGGLTSALLLVSWTFPTHFILIFNKAHRSQTQPPTTPSSGPSTASRKHYPRQAVPQVHSSQAAFSASPHASVPRAKQWPSVFLAVYLSSGSCSALAFGPQTWKRQGGLKTATMETRLTTKRIMDLYDDADDRYVAANLMFAVRLKTSFIIRFDLVYTFLGI